ncbi:hypothetical protein Dda_0728 [Drechslerella dactyloides]|uniref:Uncharacterized protein n=1 Tax=Drechslerella dactyloides TaxID=74499 RepID=A0AAD6NM97_DREDA|nr:hypothetical protein Dda_0728 [Drechslerella dactyloides]
MTKQGIKDNDKRIVQTALMLYPYTHETITAEDYPHYQSLIGRLNMLRDREEFLNNALKFFAEQPAKAKLLMMAQCEKKIVKWCKECRDDKDHTKFATRLWKLRDALQAVDRDLARRRGWKCGLWRDFIRLWPFVDVVLDQEFGEGGSPAGLNRS